MGLYVANKAVFIHVHKLRDGRVIEHSHPYDKAGDPEPYKSHHHSNTEFVFLQNLDVLFTEIAVVFVFLALCNNAGFSSPLYYFHSQAFYNLNKGRAPPVS